MVSLYWLCYRHNNQISVVIEPGASPIHARMWAEAPPHVERILEIKGKVRR
jgi:hypothetical protein